MVIVSAHTAPDANNAVARQEYFKPDLRAVLTEAVSALATNKVSVVCFVWFSALLLSDFFIIFNIIRW
jgi:hypothetical protein